MGDDLVRGRSRTRVFTEIACSIWIVIQLTGIKLSGLHGLTTWWMNFAREDISISHILFYLQNPSDYASRQYV